MSRIERCLVRAWGLTLLSALSAHSATISPTSPTGGESWCVGSRHVITWKHEGASRGATVKIEFSPDGGSTWRVLAPSAPDSGRWTWGISEATTERAKLRISAGTEVAETPTNFKVVPSREVADYRWVEVTSKAPFAARDGAGAVVFNDKMWLLGGWNPSDKVHFPRICSNDVWNSADGLNWSLVKPNTFVDPVKPPVGDWEGRHTAGYVVHQGKMWIVGGDVNQKHYQNDVWSSTDGKVWNQVNEGKPVPWGPRALHHTVAFRGKIWVMGGQTMPAFAESSEVFHRDVWNSSDGVNWTKLSPKEPFWSPRGMIGGSAVLGGRMWVLGGGTYDTPKTTFRRYFNDVWSTADGISWRNDTAVAPWEPRQYHDVAVFDNRLWVTQGYNLANRNDVWYSDDGVNWYELPKTPWAARHASSLFVFRDALWVVAGNNMQPDVWKLERAR